jgi:hypothetical protein
MNSFHHGPIPPGQFSIARRGSIRRNQNRVVSESDSSHRSPSGEAVREIVSRHRLTQSGILAYHSDGPSSESSTNCIYTCDDVEQKMVQPMIRTERWESRKCDETSQLWVIEITRSAESVPGRHGESSTWKTEH